MDSEIVIPCSGDSEMIILCNNLDNQNVFFGGITKDFINIPLSGVGGSITIQKNQISILLCIETYDMAKNNITNYTEMFNFSKDTVQIYINNWELLCSDLVNRSLSEGLICRQIPYYNNFIELKKDLNRGINISDYLLNYYISNYDNICSKDYSIISPNITKDYTIYLIIFFLIIISVIFLIIKRKHIVSLIKK